MIAEWDTDTLFVSDLLEKKQPAVFASLHSALNGLPIQIIPGTADIWCRDYMPIQLDQDRFCQFVYAPDYLRDDPELVTPPETCRLPLMKHYRQEQIVLDGGNVVASRTKVILTEKVFTENPTIPRASLVKRLEDIFQAECIFIPHDPEDDAGHSDGVVRFISEDRVLINDYSTVDPDYGEKVRNVLEEKGLAVDMLPLFEEKGPRRPAGFLSAVGVYINYLRVANIVVAPAYNRPQDELALRKLQHALPDARVSQVRCRRLARKGGVLNCVSWTIKMGRRTL